MSQLKLAEQERRLVSTSDPPAKTVRDIAVTFRPAAPEHYPTIAGLLPTPWELFCAHPAGRYPLTAEQVAALVKRRLEPTAMLADGRVAGFACFYRHRPGRSIFIGNVMIEPGMRKQGFARRIMVHMVELAFGKYDLPQVRVSIVTENTPSLLGCVQGGFRPYGVIVRRNKNGKPLPLLNLRLDRDRYLKATK